MLAPGVLDGAGWRLRSLRAATFAGASLTLGVGAHRLGGGLEPAHWVWGAAFLLLFAAAWAGARHRRTLPGIAAAVVAGQAGLHVLFERTAASPSLPVDVSAWRALLFCREHGAAVSDATVLRTRALLGLSGSTPGSSAPHPMSMGSMSAPMLGAHLLAALVVAWWLARGEAAVWEFTRTAALTWHRAVSAVVTGAVAAFGAPARLVALRCADALTTLLLHFDRALRGPPRPAFAAH